MLSPYKISTESMTTKTVTPNSKVSSRKTVEGTSPAMLLIGKTVRKHFQGFGWYYGTVFSYDTENGLYLIQYEDGDKEELDKNATKKITLETKLLSPHKVEAKSMSANIVTPNSKDRFLSKTLHQGPFELLPIGTSVRKYFKNHGWYNGTIVSYDEYYELYLVQYEDGDKEELREDQVKKILVDSIGKMHSSTVDELGTKTLVDSTKNIMKNLAKETFGETSLEESFKNVDQWRNKSIDKGVNMKENIPKARESQSSTSRPIQIGSKVRKYFKGYGWFRGIVVSKVGAHDKISASYIVRYEDGDEEELSDKMVRNLMLDAKSKSIMADSIKGKRKLQQIESSPTDEEKHDAAAKKICPDEIVSGPRVFENKRENCASKDVISKDKPSENQPSFDLEIGAEFPHLGCRVARFFDKDKIYYGTVKQFSPGDTNELGIDLWTVRYLDGDEEELNKTELDAAREWAAPAQLNSVGIEFAHFIHYRMTVWMQHYPERARNEIMGNTGTRPAIHKSTKFSWKLASCAKMGNAYRHLDTGTKRFGDMIRMKVGGAENSDPATWSEDQIQQSVIMAVMKMTGFRPEILRTFFKSWANLPLEACYPSTVEELDILTRYLRCLQNQETRPTLFHAKFQTQGFRWIEYFASFTNARLNSVVSKIMHAKTWGTAVLALQNLPGVGAYSAAQSLCDIFMGVWQQKRGLFHNHADVVDSMANDTGIGPGPIYSLQKIFPDIENKDNALKILRESIDNAFQEEGLEFPYLKDQNGQTLHLSCVDLEHSLCYFHRYLVSKESLGENGIERLYEKFNEPRFKDVVPLPSIKQLESVTSNSVDAWCDKRYKRFVGK